MKLADELGFLTTATLMPPRPSKKSGTHWLRRAIIAIGALWVVLLCIHLVFILQQHPTDTTPDFHPSVSANQPMLRKRQLEADPFNSLRNSVINTTIPSDGVVENDDKRWHKSAHSSAFVRSVCPHEGPVEGYPREWPVNDVIKNWNPDDTLIPPRHFASLCRFDYATELGGAKAYREAEVPFIVHGVPAEMALAQERWADAAYLSKKFAGRRFLTEVSRNNHFMYFNEGGHGKIPAGWTAPVENMKMGFNEWLAFALSHDNFTAETVHKYFRTNSMESSWVAQDLKALTPEGDKDGLFIAERKSAKGIHCRFGMRGVVAAAHFDGSRNFVCVMGGHRRYMLAKPSNCQFLHLYPKGHPSGRHSEVDWSAPVEANNANFPDFQKASVNEVILEAGDFLYIPSGWVHYIMSLNVNWQCNARSGKSSGQASDLRSCGF